MLPAQHARRKVLIECREGYEKPLHGMGDQKIIITPVAEQMELASSLMYPKKSNGSLGICLVPSDLNKAIILEQYKALNLDKITHKLSRPNVFLN